MRDINRGLKMKPPIDMIHARYVAQSLDSQFFEQLQHRRSFASADTKLADSCLAETETDGQQLAMFEAHIIGYV